MIFRCSDRGRTKQQLSLEVQITTLQCWVPAHLSEPVADASSVTMHNTPTTTITIPCLLAHTRIRIHTRSRTHFAIFAQSTVHINRIIRSSESTPLACRLARSLRRVPA
jgi:hypothetical protein